MPNINLTYTVTAEETLAWDQYSYRTLDSYRKERRSWIISGYVIATVWGVVLVRKLQKGQEDWLFAVTIVTLGLLTPYWYDWAMDRMFREAASEPPRSADFGEHRLILSDEGLRDIAPVAESFVRWANVSACEVVGDHLIISLSSGLGAILSRRSYSGPIPFDELSAKINELKARSA